MTFADVRARLRRGFARIWAKVKKVFHVNQAGWGSDAASPAHEFYRTQYERMVDLLPALPRKPDNETTTAFLAFSQVVQQLHEMGDDPINPPGITRVVRPEERLSAFGPVGVMSKPAGFVGSLAGGNATLWVGAALLVVAGSGWVTNEISSANYRAERAAHMQTKGKLEDASVIASRLGAELRSARGQLELLEEQRDRSVAAAAAANRAAAESRQRERARNHAIQSVLVNDEPPAWSLRDDPARPAASGGDSGPARNNPR